MYKQLYWFVFEIKYFQSLHEFVLNYTDINKLSVQSLLNNEVWFDLVSSMINNKLYKTPE